MTVDLDAATAFMAGHARLLDRRRLDHRLGRAGPDAVLVALDAYRNADGGYGWGLEPDLRSPESQPVAAMVALDVLAEVGSPSASSPALLDWLDSTSLADGGLPLALPTTRPEGCAGLWVEADPSTSSLQMTTQVAANAHRVAVHDPDVAAHPWLEQATSWCLRSIDSLDDEPVAHELMFVVQFLDALARRAPVAPAVTDRVRAWIPADGSLVVQGGAEGEVLRPLDLAPYPGGLAQELLRDGVIAADLDRLAAAQQPDGGWEVTFPAVTAIADLEWRGDATVRAVGVLQDHGRI